MRLYTMCVTSHSITFCVSEKNNEKKNNLKLFFSLCTPHTLHA